MNYYVILGVPLDADDESIRHAFRVLARRFHPDAGVG
jgi:molecular chaperone DnaJ